MLLVGLIEALPTIPKTGIPRKALRDFLEGLFWGDGGSIDIAKWIVKICSFTVDYILLHLNIIL